MQIGEILGRKILRTDEPTERVDTKILETLSHRMRARSCLWARGRIYQRRQTQWQVIDSSG